MARVVLTVACIMSFPLPVPAHAACFASKHVWMESDAIAQLEHAARLEGCVRARGMPDLHPGAGGTPIGAALAFLDRVMPQLLGADIGCGARVTVTTLGRPSLDRLERNLHAVFDNDELPWGQDDTLLHTIASIGPRALADREQLPSSLQRLAEQLPHEPELLSSADPSHDALDPIHLHALGTMGGGNHFVEVAIVREVQDAQAAARWNIHAGALVVLAHAGSRSLGMALARRWGPRVLRTTGEIDEFLLAHELACRFARANRFLLTWQALSALGGARPGKLAFAFDTIHNSVETTLLDGSIVYLHRKGVAPAMPGEPTIVLGTRGSPSWLVVGNGTDDSLYSTAHGAGRRMTRSEARAKVKARYARKQLARTPLGSRVLCDRTDSLYEEHPDAYKAIEPVMESLFQAGLVTPLAVLEPLITVKQ